MLVFGVGWEYGHLGLRSGALWGFVLAGCIFEEVRGESANRQWPF